MDISYFDTDQEAEVKGKWVDAGDGAQWLIARAQNERYNRALHAELQKNRALIDQDDYNSIEVQKEITKKLYAKYCLLGWKGMTKVARDENGEIVRDNDGNPVREEVPYSQELALELLRKKDFFDKVRAFADNFQQFQVTAEEEAVKN